MSALRDFLRIVIWGALRSLSRIAIRDALPSLSRIGIWGPLRSLPRVAIWGALSLAPLPVAAQLSVYPVQSLAFGTIPAGAPAVVASTDVARRAELDVTGNGVYTLNVILPNRMVSVQGKQLPISFSGTDGIVYMPRLRVTYHFDPNQPNSLWIPFWETGVSIYLGGTANPGASQPPGQYTATITVQIINSGT
jgi:Domain of unknown function (DUF4402)